MKSVFKCFALAILLSFVTNSLFAVIAYPYPVEITQPDGSKLTVILKGDEHIKWAQTIDGYSILRNSKGVFEYAIKDAKGDIIPSGIRVSNIEKRSNAEVQLLHKTSKNLVYSKSQVSILKSISKLKKTSPSKSFPTTGSRKLICILMEFQDVRFSKTNTDFQNLFNQVGYTADGATGSVKDYYKENSYNQLDLTVTVAGPYTAANNMVYYGGNDGDGNDLRPDALVSEAVTKANVNVNYADFDNDGNGYVDGVYVIYAGYGEEAGGSTNAIWAHAWEIPTTTLDGKIISSYSCSPELRNNIGTGITRIGVICHEFGHVLGAPDYYDVDYGSSGGEFLGTGDWDMMASGSWNNNGATPAHHNVYTKVYVYNWATASTINTTSSLTLNNAELNSNSFYRINTATSNEYFLLENRQKYKFDSYLPGHGLLVYHVDGDYINAHFNNNDINVSSHQGLYSVCASATSNPSDLVNSFGDINSGGCSFPGLFGKTSLGDNTTPSMKSWAAANTNKPITNIVENTTNKTVSFTVTASTGVNDDEAALYKLGQNYPNPFDNSTNIDFTLVNPSKIKLTVFNSLGQVVDVIVDEFLFAGNYSYTWSPKNVASGIYFYQLNVDGNKEVKRMVKR